MRPKVLRQSYLTVYAEKERIRSTGVHSVRIRMLHLQPLCVNQWQRLAKLVPQTISTVIYTLKKARIVVFLGILWVNRPFPWLPPPVRMVLSVLDAVKSVNQSLVSRLIVDFASPHPRLTFPVVLRWNHCWRCTTFVPKRVRPTRKKFLIGYFFERIGSWKMEL